MKLSCAISVEKLLQQLAEGKQVDAMKANQFITKQIKNSCINGVNALLAATLLSEGFS